MITELNNMRSKDYKKIDAINEQLKKDPKNLDLLMQKAFVYFQGYGEVDCINTY